MIHALNPRSEVGHPRIEVRRHAILSPWSYSLLDARQRQIQREVLAGECGALLLSEVAPVITLGRRALPSELLVTQEVLARMGIEVFPTDRGGLATYHGPGQWVLFVVDSLERLTGDPRGVRKAVEGLMETALVVGRLYDPSAEIRSGAETGVWTSRGKFAAVGVHIQEGVVLHGLSVNGFRTPTSFFGLRPCGLDAPVDFLLREEGELGFDQLGERLITKSLERFWKKSSHSSVDDNRS